MTEKIAELEKKLKSFPVSEVSRKKVDVLNDLSRQIIIENPKRDLKLTVEAEIIARKLSYKGYRI